MTTVNRKDEEFIMQSKLDKMTRQYVTDTYGSGIATLISLYSGRKIRLSEKLSNGQIRVYKIKNSFDLLNPEAPRSQNFSIHDKLKFDTETGRISKYM